MVVTQGRVRPTSVHGVVVGVDGSSSSGAALAFAAAMAASLGEDVVPTHVDRGHVAHSLVEYSRAADLLVVGRPDGGGHGALPDWSIPVHVARRARCPVVVVPGDWHPDDGTAPVSVGLDVPRHGLSILRAAFRIGRAQHRPVQVLHLWRPSSDALHPWSRARVPGGPADWQLDPISRQVQDAVSRACGDFPGVAVEIAVRHEAPGPALEAASRRSALLVVGRHSRPRRPTHGLGTVARHVLRNARSPVLVVDPDARREEMR